MILRLILMKMSVLKINLLFLFSHLLINVSLMFMNLSLRTQMMLGLIMEFKIRFQVLDVVAIWDKGPYAYKLRSS